MKNYVSFILFVSEIFFANQAKAAFFSHNTSLLAKIKPNLTLESKPTASSIKLAAVTFLPDLREKIIRTDCENGWILTNGACVENKCEGFSFQDNNNFDHCNAFASCKSGSVYKYRCQQCSTGWHLMDNACIENDCIEYPLTVEECDSHKGSCIEDYCYSGEVAKTYYDSCNEGWALDETGKLCEAREVPEGYSVSQTIEGCNSLDTFKSGDEMYYTCRSCGGGYDLIGGACSVKSVPEGYMQSQTDNCSEYNTFQSGNDTYYCCKTCNAEYSVVDCKCQKTCSYTSTSLPNRCSQALSCDIKGTTYYDTACTKCNNGWTANASGVCTANICSGYGSYYYDAYYSSILNCQTTSTCKSGNDTLYKCQTCKSGFQTTSFGHCVSTHSDIGKCVNSAKNVVSCSSATAVGVIYYKDSSTTKIVALTNVKKDGTAGSEYMYWSFSSSQSGYYGDISALTNYTSSSTCINDMDGAGNTQKIIAYNADYEAAKATSLYSPSTCGGASWCAKGKWYLPSMGELQLLYDAWMSSGKVYSGISAAGGTQMSYSYYWSSTEYSASDAWNLNFTNGDRWNRNKYNSSYVRPVLAF